MPMKTYPLAVPEDLLAEVRSASEETGFAMADVMRQTMKLGLPRFREQYLAGQPLKPFTQAEIREAFASEAEFDALEKALVARSHPVPEAD